MRVLCTADWHLGKTLEGRDRLGEQAAFLREILGICEDQSIDLVLVAGDVFDTYNPPAAAEQLFYDAVTQMSNGGTRAIVVIAGNHDAPERLVAAGPLAMAHGVTLIGTPAADLAPETPGLMGQALKGGRSYRRDACPSWLNLAIPGVPHDVIIAAVPYPSESRLREALPDTADDKGFQQVYAERIRRLMDGLSTKFHAGAVNLCISHFYAAGGNGTESERPIELGGACAVPADALPAGAQFIGLGHLHRPQSISGAPAPCMYPGSPLAYSFSEAGQEKSVIIVDVEPGKVPEITRITLTSGRSLVRLSASGGLPHAFELISREEIRDAWVELELHLDTYPNPADIQELRDACPGLVTIKPIIRENLKETGKPQLKGLQLDEVFRLFVRSKGGGEADPELIRLFMELAVEEGAEEGLKLQGDARVLVAASRDGEGGDGV